MASDTTFTPQILGETEKALNAILYRQLAASGLDEHQWITLRLTAAAGGEVARDELAARLTGALKVDAGEAQARIEELTAAGLIQPTDGGQVAVTEAGARVHARVRGETSEITHRLWGDLPAADLEITGRTLATILKRANAHYGVA